MRAILRKWLPFFLAIIVFQVIIIIIVVIWIFKDASGFFRSIYDIISKSPVALDVFNFMADYAEFFSGLVVCIALVIILVNLKRYNRDLAVNRLHNWARNGVVILAQYRQEKTGAGDSPMDRYEGVRVLVDKLITNSKLALTNARYLRGEVNEKTRRTVEEIHVVREKLANEDNSLFDDLQVLQHDFADVMILAFELIK
jgi:hypothetical protein